MFIFDKNKNKITIFFFCCSLTTYALCATQEVKLAAELETDEAIAEEVIQREHCGGTLEGDEGDLTYPGAGFSINPGENCIWTIHLQTRNDFRMNFTNFDIPGGTAMECPEASLNIYALTNLAPAGELENYVFCNEADTGGRHYLPGNIATVILWTNTDFPMNRSGFSLHWSGSILQLTPTEHSSSYSNSLSGGFLYPFEEEYPPNAGMTWLVHASRANNESLQVDINVNSMDLENCTNTNKCLCDAVIIYQISLTGVLSELDRFCGERSSEQLLNIEKDFIIALYSDSVDTLGSGYGFDIKWKKSSQQLTTELPVTEIIETTTEESWERSTTPSSIFSECGGIINMEIGSEPAVIRYKYNQDYDNNEQCIWTIRHNTTTTCKFIKTRSNFEDNYDFLQILTFLKTSSQNGPSISVKMGITNGFEELDNITAPVMFVVFTTDGSVKGQGFNLEIYAIRRGSTYNYKYTDFFSDSVSGSGSLQPYLNNMMSTFVISPQNIYDLHIDLIHKTEAGYDFAHVFRVERNGLVIRYYLLRSLSGSGHWIGRITDYTSYVIIFVSDGDTIGGNGISFEWSDSLIGYKKTL